ncbi:F-box/RNI-like/FBD-like domains-containing protein [Rhynchospora pubera]|uniref:F-box/RNI-like/FBD-like domains-containing protein n=1 Tax=Rhynchospora pubera TaxID=906938 RepID=A0AAV8D1S1_9POAL|nr:F-box/RNI-like/FBD-like domains-containing protein [Rhynchospora pubera]
MDNEEHQKGSVTYNDRITDLPDDLKCNILAHLPLKEMVETSLLSRMWHYTWASIPNLVFNERNFMSIRELVRFVDMVLLLHQGPIFQFNICCLNFTHVPMERWMLVLSRNEIEEITIRSSLTYRWRICSCFFNIQSLKKVYLKYCTLILPHVFRGLKHLQTLHLNGCTISDNDFEKLVSHCPLLENLYTSNGKYGHEKCMIDVFGSLSKVETLRLGGAFIRYLLLRGCNLELPLKFEHLKELSIELAVHNQNEAYVAFFLLQNAPNVQYLSILNRPQGPDGLMPIRNLQNLNMQKIAFEHLKFVLIDYSGSVKESGLLLVKLLLSAAPLLEKVHIKNYEKDFEFVKKLVSFKRASKEAEVILFD